MAHFSIYFIFKSILVLTRLSSTMDCLTPNIREYNRFYLLKGCHRSVQPIVGLANTKSARECEIFTKSVKGLAFNFTPLRNWKFASRITPDSANGNAFPRKASRKHVIDQPEEFYSCHALMCPEASNLTTLVKDSRFMYYTLYSNPVPPVNATCIPEVGLFQLYNTRKNFNAAFRTCTTESKGSLAHVLSESRTNRLAQFLQERFEEDKTLGRMAFVGLNYSLPQTEFRTSEWESLQCFPYRAWAPGYPRQHGNHSCAAIKTDRSWTTLDCDQNLPFICEVYTSGPSKEDPGTCYGYKGHF